MRLFSFWVEQQDEQSSGCQRRAWARNNKKRKVMTDLESFKTEIRKSGVSPDGVTLCNCEMTGGNDISLIYPWVNINSLSQDIWGWVDREEASKDHGDIGSPDTTAAARRKLSQGTYCIVETVVPSSEIPAAALGSGEQLCVLLGFRTTDDNCVDTAEADSERSQEARSWRDWTGIGTLYQNLVTEELVTVAKIEFLESHLPYHSAVFHYIVLVYLQVEDSQGKVGVLDVVARFRVRNMSGYVTVYYSFADTADTAEQDSVVELVRTNADTRQQARRQFFAVN